MPRVNRPAAALALSLVLAACQSKPETPAETRASEAAAPAPVATGPVILAFGDSLYAGYQLLPTASYPARLQAALAKAGLPAQVVNAGVSGDTSADGLQRLAFTLDNQPAKPALVLLGLGGNDMLRGLPPAQTKANLEAILAELDKRRIPVVLTGMLAPPNMGADYEKTFDAIYPALAKAHHAALVPFLLQPIVGHPEWQLADHIHPNETGVDRIVAASLPTVQAALKSATPIPR